MTYEACLMVFAGFAIIAILIIFYKYKGVMSDKVHEAQVAEVDKMVSGKTVLSFQLPTPKWATYIFRTEFVLNKAITMYLTGTGTIEPDKVKEYLLIMTIVDFVAWLFARSVGIKKDDVEKEFTV